MPQATLKPRPINSPTIAVKPLDNIRGEFSRKDCLQCWIRVEQGEHFKNETGATAVYSLGVALEAAQIYTWATGCQYNRRPREIVGGQYEVANVCMQEEPSVGVSSS